MQNEKNHVVWHRPMEQRHSLRHTYHFKFLNMCKFAHNRKTLYNLFSQNICGSFNLGGSNLHCKWFLIIYITYSLFSYLTTTEARFERHKLKDPKINLTCTPKRGRDIDVEDPLSFCCKRNKTKAHPTTSCNTSATERYIGSMYYFFGIIDSLLLYVLNKYVYILYINTYWQL